MAGVRIYLDPASPGLADLERLIAQADNTTGLLKNLGEALLATTQDRFDSQTSPSGAAWAPLSALTVSLRGAAGPILTRTGRLRGSLSYQVAGDTLRLGPNTVDAAAHQFGVKIQGTRYGTVTLPARPYIGFGAADERAARDTVLDWFSLL